MRVAKVTMTWAEPGRVAFLGRFALVQLQPSSAAEKWAKQTIKTVAYLSRLVFKRSTIHHHLHGQPWDRLSRSKTIPGKLSTCNRYRIIYLCAFEVNVLIIKIMKHMLANEKNEVLNPTFIIRARSGRFSTGRRPTCSRSGRGRPA
jgi:hypothetical protein